MKYINIKSSVSNSHIVNRAVSDDLGVPMLYEDVPGSPGKTDFTNVLFQIDSGMRSG